MNYRKIFASVCSFLFLFLFYSCLDGNKSIDLYVSVDGNDTNSGEESAPFQSIEKAREAVRLIRKQNPGKSIEVTIQGGTWYLGNTIVFTEDDSGSKDAPVIYKAAEGEEPVFSGSIQIKNWHLLTDETKLKLLSPEVNGKVYVADLRAAGITDYGDPTETGKRPELFCDGLVQTLARWPNEGFTHAGLVKGKTEMPPTYIKKRGTKEGIFGYLDKRQNRWKEEQDVRLGGYWYWDWADEFQKVEKIDTLSKIIYMCEPYHHYGYGDSSRYFGLNLFCEIDQAKEWYLDRKDGLIYWYPPEDTDPNQAKVSLSVFNEPYMVKMENCTNVILKGLSFQEGRGSAIQIQNGEDCLISGCRIERFGADGISVNGGFRNGISGCMLRVLGCKGISMRGGDRKNLIPSEHYVENTVVEYFSLFKRTYQPAVGIGGCGNRISHNRFRYSSSSAIGAGGNDHIIEYNEISHVVSESDDQGGFDMWGDPSARGNIIRYNRWSYISGGTVTGAAGVRLDDMISGFHIHGNIFEWCGAIRFGGVQIHGGKDNLVENNLFYKCYAAASFTPWGERWQKKLNSPEVKKKIYEQVDIRSSLYQEKYPELKDILSNEDVNTLRNNLLVDCTNRFLRNNGRQILENNVSVMSEGKTLEEFYSPELMKRYGMQPVPVQEIGPKNNKWLK